jgi:hypothetical protein
MLRAKSALLSAFLLTAQGSPLSAQPLVDEEFDGLVWETWCPCQVSLDGESKLDFLTEGDVGFARFTVVEGDIGGNRCRKKEGECEKPHGLFVGLFAGILGWQPDGTFDASDDLPERLGPSLIVPEQEAQPEAPAATMPVPYPDGGPYCTPEKRAEGLARNEDTDTPCAQRQELRFQDAEMHSAGEPLLYSFRFRMPQNPSDTTSSVRWVTAQWKQEPAVQPPPITPGREWGPSPFLSQRFENGVLNVVVQDQECRCLVAAAETPEGIGWTEKPQRCFSVREGAAQGEGCSAKPDLRAVYGANPLLPDPRGRWVTMRYRVKPGRNGAGRIEVYDDERLVVTITGSIGYDEVPGDPSYVKFKIGHYNDFMPGSRTMDVDWLTVSAQ